MSFVINQKIKYNVVQEREIFFDNERLAQLNKYIHKNSGVQYVLREGKQFDLSGKPINDAKYSIIDFKLSKDNN